MGRNNRQTRRQQATATVEKIEDQVEVTEIPEEGDNLSPLDIIDLESRDLDEDLYQAENDGRPTDEALESEEAPVSQEGPIAEAFAEATKTGFIDASEIFASQPVAFGQLPQASDSTKVLAGIDPETNKVLTAKEQAEARELSSWAHEPNFGEKRVAAVPVIHQRPAPQLDQRNQVRAQIMQALLPATKAASPKSQPAAKKRETGPLGTPEYKFFRRLEDTGALSKFAKYGSLRGMFQISALTEPPPASCTPGASGAIGTAYTKFCWAIDKSGQILLVHKVYERFVEAVMATEMADLANLDAETQVKLAPIHEPIPAPVIPAPIPVPSLTERILKATSGAALN